MIRTLALDDSVETILNLFSGATTSRDSIEYKGTCDGTGEGIACYGSRGTCDGSRGYMSR